MKHDSREVSGNIAKGPEALPPSLEIQLFGVSWREVSGYLAGAVLLAVVMTASGAFDTDEIGVPHRMALWLVVSALMVSQTLVLDGLIAPRLPASIGGRIGAGALSVLGVIVLMTFELHALKYTPLLSKAPDPLWDFALFLVPPVGSVAGFVVLTRILAPEGLQPGLPQTKVLMDTPSSDVRRKTGMPEPDPQGWPSGPILSVRAHDHYLEIAAAGRRSFVRGRMSDALHRLAGEDGIQPHRSWWVARSEIARIRRQGRDYVLETHDGTEIPVGRSRISGMRDAGFFAPE